jgi:hypothetical protein
LCTFVVLSPLDFVPTETKVAEQRYETRREKEYGDSSVKPKYVGLVIFRQSMIRLSLV